MLDIKHTICPSCSVGCGLNIVSKDGAVVGTYPYKRHPINEGKNCLNGRNSILQFDNQIEKPSIVKNGELEESDYETVFKLIKDQLASIDASELAILCSGNSTNEELDKIKEFADGCGCKKIGFYGYNFPNFSDDHLADKIDAVKGELDENSIIVANKICCKDDFALLEALSEETNAKLLPVFNAPNMKGAMSKFDSLDIEEVKDLIGGSKVLIVVKDNLLDYLSADDIKGKGFIVNISNEDNAFAKLSDVVLPGKSWVEKSGTFTNCEGLEQCFNISAEIENDNLSEMEIFDELA